jgi:hypothetical protein
MTLSAAALAACVLSSGLSINSATAQSGVSADAVKAAYLYNFGSYVEWPSDALTAEEITIGVVGADAVVRELRGLLPGRTIENRHVQVRPLTPASSLQHVQILYIGSAPREDVASLLDSAAQRPILVITDTPDGMQRGSMINFVLEDRRVRFEISRGAAERARLKLSSRLLSVALRVHSSGLPLEPTPGGATLASLSRR